MNLKGLISFAIGGSLLVFVLYFVISSAQSPNVSFGSLINSIAFGFAAFLLLGLGLFLIIESAVASKR